MSWLLQHLKERHLDVSLHRPVIDDSAGVVTFFLWNLSGQLVGYQKYNPSALKAYKNLDGGRYFTYRKQPTVGVWGVESLHLTPKLVFVTEGVFDAARLTKRGFSALAALSNDPARDLKNWLMSLNRLVVTVCDNDKAGKKLAKFGHLSLSTGEKDLGESSEADVSKIIGEALRRL